MSKTTRHNTTQHDTTRDKTSTTRHNTRQHDTARVQHETTQVQNNIKFILIYLYHRCILGGRYIKALFML